MMIMMPITTYIYIYTVLVKNMTRRATLVTALRPCSQLRFLVHVCAHAIFFGRKCSNGYKASFILAIFNRFLSSRDCCVINSPIGFNTHFIAGQSQKARKIASINGALRPFPHTKIKLEAIGFRLTSDLHH